MYRSKTVAVVIPIFNEEKLISATIQAIPLFVDKIIAVNDASCDSTGSVLSSLKSNNKKIEIITHASNGGVGRAISSGYSWCFSNDIDICVVIAGDNQMECSEMPSLLDPIVEGTADYAKGNRLSYPDAHKIIPPIRYVGILILTFFTKIITGYKDLEDAQCGYTAISKQALSQIPISDIYPRYGMPNDLLVTLSIFNLRVINVPVKPVYNIGETSGIRLGRDIFLITLLFLRLGLRSLKSKIGK